MTKGSTNYTWTRGRLLASLGAIEFEYDCQGRRTRKITNGSVPHEYFYDGDKLIAEIYNGVTLCFFYDESGVCGMRCNGANYEFVRNIFGDVIRIYDVNGDLKASYTYDAWGNCTVEINQNNIANINPFRYRGYYYDTETNLYYLQTRYYDPSIGQFISPDTQNYLDPQTIGGVDLYAYGLNNPVMFVDPTGHFAISISAIVTGMLIGAIVGGAISGISAYYAGERGWDLAWDVVGGAIFGAANGLAMALGGAAAVGAASVAKGIELTLGSAISISIVATGSANVIKYFLDCVASDNAWDPKQGFVAGSSGAWQGISTFGIAYLGGKNGLFNEIDSYGAFESIYGGINMTPLQTLSYVSKLALGDAIAKVVLVSGTSAIIRFGIGFIINLIFGS